VLLPPEAAALSQPGSATSWLTQDSGASGTDNHGLGMAEHGGDPVTSWTLNIHKVAVWVLDQTLQLVLPEEIQLKFAPWKNTFLVQIFWNG